MVLATLPVAQLAQPRTRLYMERMDKTQVLKVKTSEQVTDFAYWQSRTPQQRLAALDAIRREYHLWYYGTESRFQRVLRIVEQK
jgi:hypothetical protein